MVFLYVLNLALNYFALYKEIRINIFEILINFNAIGFKLIYHLACDDSFQDLLVTPLLVLDHRKRVDLCNLK